MRNNERGITLVALVVTIVVLLILAGITITYVLSDNGIFGTAQKASTATDDANVTEAVSMAMMALQTQVYDPDAPISEVAAAKTAFDKSVAAYGVTSAVTFSVVGTNGITVAADSKVTYKGVDYTVVMDTVNATPVPLKVTKVAK